MSSNLSKRSRDDEPAGLGFEPDSVKRLREDLLDDSYPVESNQDLDSVIRSLEEEISNSISISSSPVTEPESGESGPDLRYLLWASDDELGLPPASGEEETGLGRVGPGPTGFCWFEEEFPRYEDGFGFGDGDGFYVGSEDGYVAVGGLFEYTDDVVFDSLPAQ